MDLNDDELKIIHSALAMVAGGQKIKSDVAKLYARVDAEVQSRAKKPPHRPPPAPAPAHVTLQAASLTGAPPKATL